ncbi:MAG: SMC-Scp complex subunit ScpB [Minisyncoccia bacterium]
MIKQNFLYNEQMENAGLASKIEAILFYSGEPVELSFLVKILEMKREEILDALDKLRASLESRGVRLLEQDEEYSLFTAPEYSKLIEKMIKEERERDLGRAGIETLSIIAYKGPVTKKEIEYIRGVNSQYALRNLLLRGLVERKASKEDERQVQYSVTLDTIRFLGLNKISDLPEYGETIMKLESNLESEKEETETE